MSQFLVLRFGGNLKCNFGKMYFYSRNNFINDFFYCLLLYSIISISFSQEEQTHDFSHLLRIRSLIILQINLEVVKHSKFLVWIMFILIL